MDATRDQAEKATVHTEETTGHAEETTDRADRLDPTRFSSCSHLLHVTGWMCRFITNCRSTKDSRESEEGTYT